MWNFWSSNYKEESLRNSFRQQTTTTEKEFCFGLKSAFLIN